jgi:hypothetical protein
MELTSLQRRPTDNDERVILLVLPKRGNKFTKGLFNDIKPAIRTELSPRHVPKSIFEAPEMPVSNLHICEPLSLPLALLKFTTIYSLPPIRHSPRSLPIPYSCGNIKFPDQSDAEYTQ